MRDNARNTTIDDRLENAWCYRLWRFHITVGYDT